MNLSSHHTPCMEDCKHLWDFIQVTGKSELSIFRTSLGLEVRQEPQARTDSLAVFLSSQHLHGVYHSS